MKEHRQQGGSKVLVGISLAILGGLLFAAGVMVGRGTVVSATDGKKETLGQIDRRDSDSDAVYNELLQKRPPKAVKPKAEKPNAEKPEVALKPVAAPAAADNLGKQPIVDGQAKSGRFSLQIASYKEMEQANQLLGKLSKLGYSGVHLLKSDVPGKGIYFRVRLGHFATREQAEKMKKKLAVDQALDAMIVVGD